MCFLLLLNHQKKVQKRFPKNPFRNIIKNVLYILVEFKGEFRFWADVSF